MANYTWRRVQLTIAPWLAPIITPLQQLLTTIQGILTVVVNVLNILALIIATIVNPLVVVIQALITLIEDQVDTLLGTNFYIIGINPLDKMGTTSAADQVNSFRSSVSGLVDFIIGNYDFYVTPKGYELQFNDGSILYFMNITEIYNYFLQNLDKLGEFFPNVAKDTADYTLLYPDAIMPGGTGQFLAILRQSLFDDYDISAPSFPPRHPGDPTVSLPIPPYMGGFILMISVDFTLLNKINELFYKLGSIFEAFEPYIKPQPFGLDRVYYTEATNINRIQWSDAWNVCSTDFDIYKVVGDENATPSYLTTVNSINMFDFNTNDMSEPWVVDMSRCRYEYEDSNVTPGEKYWYIIRRVLDANVDSNDYIKVFAPALELLLKSGERPKSTEPNWKTINYRQLFPQIDELVNQLISFLYGLLASVQNAANNILQMIAMLTEKIQDLQDIIDLIQDVLDFIASALALGEFDALYLPALQEGTADFVERIEGAFADPNAPQPNPSTFTGGFAFVCGGEQTVVTASMTVLEQTFTNV
ncbi:MAG: hypothetical protein WC783_02600 [Candidatus Paceibacterota bacterium]|jgi:hypothetical protein